MKAFIPVKLSFDVYDMTYFEFKLQPVYSVTFNNEYNSFTGR
jgi:hypothetical protein